MKKKTLGYILVALPFSIPIALAIWEFGWWFFIPFVFVAVIYVCIDVGIDLIIEDRYGKM